MPHSFRETIQFYLIDCKTPLGKLIDAFIILIPWQVSRVVKEWVHMASKEEINCPGCGLRYHDRDASHCKACGHLIFQEYDGE